MCRRRFAAPNGPPSLSYPLQVELIFKSWKSYLHLATLKTTKEDTTLCYLYGVCSSFSSIMPSVRSYVRRYDKRRVS